MGVLKSKFIKDTVWLQLGSFLTIGTYILTSMVLARSLGPVEFGRYDLATKFYDLCFFISNLGLINVTVVRYSHAMGGKDRDGKVLALAAFLKIYLIMAVTIVVLGFFLCPFIGVNFYSDHRVGYFGWALCTMGLIEIMRVMARAVLLGTRQMRDAACLDSAVALLRLIVLIMAVAGGYGLEGVIYGSVLHAGLSTLIGFRFFFLLRKEDASIAPPGLGEIFKAMPRATLREFFSMGFFIALNKNMVQIVLALGSFFIAKVSFHATGQLRIAMILMWGLQMLLSGINQNLLPTLGFKMGGAGHKDILRMGPTLFKVSMASGLFFIVLTGGFLLFVPTIVSLIYGPEYHDSISIVMILAAAHLTIGFGVIAEPFYIYANKVKTAVAINVVIFALLIPAGYFATENYGLTGVACYLAAARFLVVVHLGYIAWYFYRMRGQKATGIENETAGTGGAS